MPIKITEKDIAKYTGLNKTHLGYWGWLEADRIHVVNRSLRGLLQDCEPLVKTSKSAA